MSPERTGDHVSNKWTGQVSFESLPHRKKTCENAPTQQGCPTWPKRPRLIRSMMALQEELLRQGQLPLKSMGLWSPPACTGASQVRLAKLRLAWMQG